MLACLQTGWRQDLADRVRKLSAYYRDITVDSQLHSALSSISSPSLLIADGFGLTLSVAETAALDAVIVDSGPRLPSRNEHETL